VTGTSEVPVTCFVTNPTVMGGLEDDDFLEVVQVL
jgi:hypothetical protein